MIFNFSKHRRLQLTERPRKNESRTKKNKFPNYPIWALALSWGKPWPGWDSNPRPSDYDRRSSTDWATRPERELSFHGVESTNYGFRKKGWPCSTDEGNLLNTATHPILLLRSFYHQCYMANVYYVNHNSRTISLSWISAVTRRLPSYG